MFGFHTEVRKPVCLLQEVEIGGMVHLSPDWEAERIIMGGKKKRKPTRVK